MQFSALCIQHCVASLSRWETTWDITRMPFRLAETMLALTKHDASSPRHDRQACRMADRAWMTDEVL